MLLELVDVSPVMLNFQYQYLSLQQTYREYSRLPNDTLTARFSSKPSSGIDPVVFMESI